MDSTWSARMVDTLSAVWAAVRSRQTDVPAVVITLGAGSVGQRPGELKLGHFAAARWQTGTDGLLAELFVGGEGLHDGAEAVLATLLHEAAHGVAASRRVQDVSRGGRYHNRRYAGLARELGLDVAQAGTLGWSATTLPAATAAGYAAELAMLGGALTGWRRSEYQLAGPAGDDDSPAGDDNDEGEAEAGRGRKSNNNGVAARCDCDPPRRIRVATSVLDAGPIVCGLCDVEFAAP